ncbi:histone deacetylase 3 [Pancytospora epiphaga]|nr:histone deacetylase 3 [Pancytospora epiphaga]
MVIAYMYDETIGQHSYGEDHPMNPFRITMTHSLVKSFGLDKKMLLYKPTIVGMTYHPETFIESLGSIDTPDCPIFENIKEFSIRYASASINAAQLINCGSHDVVINWGGGLHHAHKNEASGFCFTNDIVMAVLELLKTHERVMYIDIDVHHGDGVEEAFYDNDRVLTLSLHKHGDGFFPDTGTLVTTGKRAINIPLQNGIDDPSYKYIYEPIIDAAIRKFRPEAIVFQSGADSLGEDRLGVFNLSIKGHGSCLSFIMKYAIPTIVLGGGGYKIHNTSRCWAYETALLCEQELPSQIPGSNPFYDHFSPDYEITPAFLQKYPNQNKKKYLDAIMGFVLDRVGRF